MTVTVPVTLNDDVKDMTKVVPQISPKEAAAKINNGDTLVVGGFGMTGYPAHVIHALARSDTRELTYIGNNIGEPGLGGGRLVRNGQIKKAIGSFFTSNPEVVEAYHAGVISCEILPQGSLSEALRAAGAGLGGFYTPAAAGTVLGEHLETRNYNGVEMVLVDPLPADVALIRAWRADTSGNLQYRMTENNFNAAAATAAKLVIVEVEEIVAVGELAPEQIHTPGIYVDFLVQASLRIEDLGSSAEISAGPKKADEQRMLLAHAALEELKPGEVVNVGVGIPTLVADLITPEHQVLLHSENGMLGVGPAPAAGGAMAYPINASKIPVTALPGSCYFDSAASFAMIRGGHIDVAVMGGLQVDEHGNLANWSLPGNPVLGVGGAMDLACGAKRVIVTMTHFDKSAKSKMVANCTLPLTAKSVVTTVITELGVFNIDAMGFELVKLMPTVTVAEILERTDVAIRVSV